MDKIFIRGLELWMRLGCTPEERAFPQRLTADIELELRLAEAGRKDDLRRTVDYSAVVARVRKTVEPKAYRIAEAAAEEVARIALQFRGVKRATVRLDKAALPGIKSFGVQVSRPEGNRVRA